MIYRPASCYTSGVHWCRSFAPGSSAYQMHWKEEIMIHHMRGPLRRMMNEPNPREGHWLTRGPKMEDLIEKDSSMAEKYHLKVCQEMIKGPFQHFLGHLNEAKCNDWSHIET